MAKAIAQSEWPDFCSTFAREHGGWLATVAEADTACLARASDIDLQGLRPLVEQQPLAGLTVETDEDTPAFIVTTGSGAARHETRLGEVIRLLVEPSRLGGEKGLRLDSRNGTSLLLVFRSGLPPESVDGLAGWER